MTVPNSSRLRTAMKNTTTAYQIAQLEVEARVTDLILQRKEQISTGDRFTAADKAAEIAVLDVLDQFLPVPAADRASFGLPEGQNAPPLDPNEQAVKDALNGVTLADKATA